MVMNTTFRDTWELTLLWAGFCTPSSYNYICCCSFIMERTFVVGSETTCMWPLRMPNITLAFILIMLPCLGIIFLWSHGRLREVLGSWFYDYGYVWWYHGMRGGLGTHIWIFQFEHKNHSVSHQKHWGCSVESDHDIGNQPSQQESLHKRCINRWKSDTPKPNIYWYLYNEFYWYLRWIFWPMAWSEQLWKQNIWISPPSDSKWQAAMCFSAFKAKWHLSPPFHELMKS